MKKILFSIALILTLSGCHDKDNPEPTPEPPTPVAQRTVLVYMSGENNLTYDTSFPGESFLADDLEELIKGSCQLNSNQHLLAFVDSVDADNLPHIVEIADGKAKEVYRFGSEFYASDPQMFHEIIQWAVDNYPANDYGLVLWGHATGWAVSNDTIASSRPISRAYGQDRGWDQTGGSEYWMNITQMARALEGLPKLKYIFADCCCFQCVESAYELRSVANYLIGSPAEIPGEGAPYEKLVPKLFSQSDTFYREICDSYYDYFIDAYQSSPYTDYSWASYLAGYSVPMAAIDLSKMDDLAVATSQVLATFAPQYPAELDLSGLPFYFGYGGYPVMYDIKSVIQKYAPSSAYTQWLTVYNQALAYSLVSRKWQTVYNSILNRFDQFPTDESQYGCVSMFFPQSTYSTASYRYNQRISQMQWYYAVGWNSFGW